MSKTSFVLGVVASMGTCLVTTRRFCRAKRDRHLHRLPLPGNVPVEVEGGHRRPGGVIFPSRFTRSTSYTDRDLTVVSATQRTGFEPMPGPLQSADTGTAQSLGPKGSASRPA
jgi:hypothetical protein